MKLITTIYEENDKRYEYIEDYKECAIYQELKTGYFIAFNNDDEQVCKETTIKIIRENIEKNMK